jgi:Yip1 domain
MTFGDRVVGAMKLDANTFDDVERDPTAMGQAMGVIALAAVSAGLGNIWYGGLGGIVFGVLSSLLGYAVWAVIVWLVGTKVMPDPATKADFPETFRVIAFAAAPGLFGIVTIIPLLGWLLMFFLWLWMIAAMVVAVRQVLDYTDTFKAVIVVIIGFVCNLVIWGMLAAMSVGTAMLGGMMGGR